MFAEYLFLRFKDGRKIHQNKALANINEFTVSVKVNPRLFGVFPIFDKLVSRKRTKIWTFGYLLVYLEYL